MVLARREKLIAAITLIIVFITICDRFLITPAIKSWRGISDRLKQTEISINKAQMIISKEDQFKHQWENLTKSSLRAGEKDPQAAFTNYLEELAKKAKVSFTNVVLIKKNEKDDYIELVFSIEFSSPIEGASKFLYYLDISPELIKIMDLNISSPSSAIETLNVKTRISVVVIKKE